MAFKGWVILALSESNLWENLAIWKNLRYHCSAGSHLPNTRADHPRGSKQAWNLALQTEVCKVPTNITEYFKAGCDSRVAIFPGATTLSFYWYFNLNVPPWQKGSELSPGLVGKWLDTPNKLKPVTESKAQEGRKQAEGISPCQGWVFVSDGCSLIIIIASPGPRN